VINFSGSSTQEGYFQKSARGWHTGNVQSPKSVFRIEKYQSWMALVCLSLRSIVLRTETQSKTPVSAEWDLRAQGPEETSAID